MRQFQIDIRQRAVLTGYLYQPSELMPVTASLPAVLIFPGGGYALCCEREGEPVALAFLGAGFQAFVLDYSTGESLGREPLRDSAAAMTLIRQHASNWGVDPQRIVTVGFSAGGHLAGWLGNASAGEDDGILADATPNAQVLCYPVITSEGDFRHHESFRRLFGEEEKAYASASLEKTVPANAPPTFLWCCEGDRSVSPVNTLRMGESLSRRGVPFELHLFAGGGHGVSLATKRTGREAPHAVGWFELCLSWLKELGFCNDIV